MPASITVYRSTSAGLVHVSQKMLEVVPLARGLLAAIKAGARLRLRPKVMTVATSIAGLIPIF